MPSVLENYGTCGLNINYWREHFEFIYRYATRFRFRLFGLGRMPNNRNDSSNSLPTTKVYDGEYEIIVSRLWNPTPQNLSDQYYRETPESLAYLLADVVDGKFKLSHIGDKSVGPNYSDFEAVFDEVGTLHLSTTVGYLVGKASPYKIKIASDVGAILLAGNTAVINPNGYDAQYRAHISIKKKK